jgi:hypothetical protein
LAINDDNPVDAFTGQTGGTWAETVAEYATQSGTDGCIQIQTATMTAAGTISGGTASITDVDAWGSVAFALLPTGPAVYSGRSDVPISQNTVTLGAAKRSGQVSTATAFGVVTAAILPTRGLVSWATFVNPLPVSIKGRFSLDSALNRTTAGRVTLQRGKVAFTETMTFVAMPKLDDEEYGGSTYGSGNYGDVHAQAAVSVNITVGIVTSGSNVNPELVTGAASFETTVVVATGGLRKRFGAVVAPETLTVATTGAVGVAEQTSLVVSFATVTQAIVVARSSVVLPLTALITPHSTTAGTVGGRTDMPVSLAITTAGIVTARSSVEFEASAINSIASVHGRRSSAIVGISANVHTVGRLNAKARVGLPVTFHIQSGVPTSFGSVSAQFVFGTRILRPTYNPGTVGYIRVPRRGRVRKGHQVELV